MPTRPARRRIRVARKDMIRYRPVRFRGMYNPSPVFTETIDYGAFAMPAATPGTPYLGQLAVAFNAIPQIGSYRSLYNQGRVLKAVFYMIPQFTEYAQQADVSSATASISCPRLVYSIQNTSDVAQPLSEIDVLTDNGCKIKQFNRPVRIACRPVPGLTQQSVGGLPVNVSRRAQWLSLDSAGVVVPHIGVNYAMVQEYINTVNPQTQWKVYCKVTFQLRDPK